MTVAAGLFVCPSTLLSHIPQKSWTQYKAKDYADDDNDDNNNSNNNDNHVLKTVHVAKTTKNAFTIPFDPNLKSDLKQIEFVKNFRPNIEKLPSDESFHRAERSIVELFAILSVMCFQNSSSSSSSSGECADAVVKEDKEMVSATPSNILYLWSGPIDTKKISRFNP
ncbi:hypothetical protein GQX74_007309 [Glossina fuscipes]|nr:hypothetical protein GQX74_007309 [Glossina fuscipes]